MNVFDSTSGSRRTRRSSLVATILGLSISTSAVEAAASGGALAMSPSDRPATPLDPFLRIHVSPGINDAHLLPRWISDRSLESAKEKAAGREGHEQWIAVVVGGDTYDYRVSVVAMRDGAPVMPTSQPVVCVCNSDELLVLLDAQIDQAAEALRASPAPAVAAAAEPEPAPVIEPGVTGLATTPAGELEQDESTQEDSRRHRRLGWLGFTGIGVGVLGAGALGAGIVLMLRPEELRRGEPVPSVHTTRPPGIGLVAGGGAALATGAALLIIDAVRHRRRAMAIAPMITPRMTGLSISTTF